MGKPIGFVQQPEPRRPRFVTVTGVESRVNHYAGTTSDGKPVSFRPYEGMTQLTDDQGIRICRVPQTYIMTEREAAEAEIAASGAQEARRFLAGPEGKVYLTARMEELERAGMTVHEAAVELLRQYGIIDR